MTTPAARVPAEGVGVRVPATSANLGPGFDALGLGLDLWDELWVRPSDHLAIEVAGEGAEHVPRDERHLVVSTLRAGLRHFGHPTPDMPLLLQAHNAIPHSRGLGSSAAAIVAGYALAWLLARPGEPLDRGQLLELSTQDEGHPDNAGAAVFGGAILAWRRSDVEATGLVQLEVDPRIRARVWIPAGELRTAQARQVLPDVLGREQVIAQASRSALLIHALATAPEQLWAGTQDWLHQQQRGALMPDSLALMERLRGAGVAAVVSGAGPTVMALGTEDQLAATDSMAHAGFTARDLAIAGGVEPLG